MTFIFILALDIMKVIIHAKNEDAASRHSETITSFTIIVGKNHFT